MTDWKEQNKKSYRNSQRCRKCEYARTIYMDIGKFKGCIHEPYKGKWTAEIDECPIGRKKDG